jgi:hypothetical protein
MEARRKERIARNEVSSRELNDKLGIGTFMCECGHETCNDVLRLPLEIYNSVRADDMRFIVKPGHEIPETEDVVVRKDDFLVVRKHEDTAHIVEP